MSIADFIFGRDSKINPNEIIDITNDYEILDILNERSAYKRVLALKDLSILLSEINSFNFTALFNHPKVKSDLKKFDYKKLFNEKLKEFKSSNKSDYNRYSDIRFKAILIVATASFYNQSNAQNLYSKLLPFMGNRDSIRATEEILELFKEKSVDEGVINDFNNFQNYLLEKKSKRKFEFCYKGLFYYNSMKYLEIDTFKNNFKKSLFESAKEYLNELLKESIDESKMIKLLMIKGFAQEEITKEFKLKLEELIVKKIKDKMLTSLPKDDSKAKEFLSEFLFIDFHKDIKELNGKLLREIDLKIEVESFINQNKLSSAKEKLKELQNKKLEVKLKEKLNLYESELKKIQNESDLIKKYNLTFNLSKFNSEEIKAKEIRENLLSTYGKKELNEFKLIEFNKEIICKKQNRVEFKMDGDIVKSFGGLSSKNTLVLTFNDNSLKLKYSISPNYNKNPSPHAINLKVSDKLIESLGEKFFVIPPNQELNIDSSTLMIGIALMVDIHFSDGILTLTLYENSDPKLKNLISKIYSNRDIWAEIKPYINEKYLFFSSEKALSKFKINYKNGYLFIDNLPIFEGYSYNIENMELCF